MVGYNCFIIFQYNHILFQKILKILWKFKKKILIS